MTLRLAEVDWSNGQENIMNKSIAVRQAKEKDALLEQLKLTPIIEIACKKTGIGKASFYRWRDSDKEFAQKAETALKEGVSLMNDIVESRLLSAIQDGNLTAIIFWLRNRNPNYNEAKTEINIGDNRKIIISWADDEILE